MSTLLFAVTVGGIVGPNISRPAGRWAESLGLERYAGPFLVSIILLLATLWVQVLLRPDLAIVAAALVAPMIVALMTSGRDCDAAR